MPSGVCFSIQLGSRTRRCTGSPCESQASLHCNSLWTRQSPRSVWSRLGLMRLTPTPLCTPRGSHATYGRSFPCGLQVSAPVPPAPSFVRAQATLLSSLVAVARVNGLPQSNATALATSLMDLVSLTCVKVPHLSCGIRISPVCTAGLCLQQVPLTSLYSGIRGELLAPQVRG